MAINTLDQYYKSIGQQLPTVQQRQGVASQAGISGYSGTADQNNSLLKYLSSNPSASSPAKEKYISSIASAQPASMPTPPAKQETPKTNNDTQSAYLKYLTGMFDPNTVESARKAKEDSAQRLADIQNEKEQKSLEARREYEKILDTSGGTTAGARDSAQLSSRRNNSELADLALRESAAARTASVYNDTYNTYLNAGKTLYEAEQAAEKAVTEQKRYDDEQAYKQSGLQLQRDQLNKPISVSEGNTLFDPVTGKAIYTAPVKASAPTGSSVLGGGSGVGGLSDLAKAVQAGTISLDKLTPSARAQVAAELTKAGVQSPRQESLSSYIDIVNSLIDSPSLGSISGVPSLKAFIPGTNAQLLKNQYDQLKGALSLENREKLKGSGAISDFEFKVLSDAASALGRNLSDKDFKSQLEKVRDVFEGKYKLTGAKTENGTTLSGQTSSGLKYTIEK